MKRFFTTKVKIVLVLALVLAVVIGIVGSVSERNVGDMLVQGILTPLRTGMSRLTDTVEQVYSYMFRYEALEAENAALREQLAAMQDEARQADSVSRENDRLRELLELKNTDEDYVFVDGYIIAWSSNEWSNTITINAGSNSGIAKDMCAVTSTGELVGLVSQVGPNYAVIETILDASLGISATIAGSGYNGMVQGGYSVESPNKLRMNYLPTDATIHINDQVVTTGSTNYPRNLILGHVIDAGFDETGVAKFAVLEPAADIGALEQVFVVTQYNLG